MTLRDPDSAAAREFDALAQRITTEVLPPVDMAGCTARILELVGEHPPA